MRIISALALLVLAGHPALAVCPPDCVAGGGPPATDCFVTWSGIPGMAVSCVDGTACDLDGKADGVCTLAVEGCINSALAGSPCTPGALDAPPAVKPSSSPAAQALTAALGALGLTGSACTPPGLAVPVKVSLGGIKTGNVKLAIKAASGGRSDKDRLRLTCEPNPAAPSFAAAVQPIFSAKCTFAGCHDSAFRGGGQSLEPDEAYSSSVNVRATGAPNLVRVRPGSLRKSFLARKLLGKGIPRFGGAVMPLGCPAVIPPVTECLTDEELFTLLAWIANGAPNN